MPNLNAKITADAKQFNSTMNKIKGKAKNVGNSFKTLAAGIGTYFSIRAIGNFVSKLDDIGKKAKAMQVTTDEFQKFAFAAERSGTNIEAVSAAMKKMNKLINDGERGLSTAKMAFNELGISIEDLDGLSQVEKFKLVARALDLQTDSTKKAALAQEFFSRGGLQLIPMLKNFSSLSEEASKHGLINAESIAAAEDLKDKMTNLNQKLVFFVTETGVIPFLDNVAVKMSETTAATKKLIDELMNTGNLADKLKLEGASGPGLNKTFWGDFKDLFLTGSTKEGFTIPAPKIGDIGRTKNELKIVAKTVAKAKEEEIKKLEAKKLKDEDIVAKQRSAISDVDKKKAEALNDRLNKLKLELEILNAEATLGKDDLARKKQEISIRERLKNASTEEERALIRKQSLVQKDILEKGIAADQSNPNVTSTESMADRLQRIGVTVGGTTINTADNERNSLLKQVNKNLNEIKDLTKLNINDIARAQ